MSTSQKILHPPKRPFNGYDRERVAYEDRKQALLATAEGQYVVFVGGEMVGPFGTEDEAERAGYEAFGLGPLYIKRVLTEESAAVLPPGVVPCRS
jgi:hypothetical protein